MKIYHIDAFTDRPFAGNPAVVCLLEHPKVESWLQNVAHEMCVSETAFLIRRGDGYNLRWFTPEVEVDLCGHATLASAYMLWEDGGVSKDAAIRFYTKSGMLIANREDSWVVLDFPALPVVETDASGELEKALGIKSLYTGKYQSDYLLEVESEEMVRGLKPDFEELCRIAMRGVAVTSRSHSGDYDFISRFFCPSLGVNEDPVTGSAHCGLGPYWANKIGKDNLVAYQASKRGGIIRLAIAGDRVLLGGHAVMVHRADLLV